MVTLFLTLQGTRSGELLSVILIKQIELFIFVPYSLYCSTYHPCQMYRISKTPLTVRTVMSLLLTSRCWKVIHFDLV